MILWTPCLDSTIGLSIKDLKDQKSPMKDLKESPFCENFEPQRGEPKVHL